jgi:hypothetical protein
VDKLASRPAPIQLLEAQTRPSFINEALETRPALEAVIILLDCRREVRRHRLANLRRRPELANPQMDAWAAYLRGQADALGLSVVDTSDLTVAAVAEQVEEIALKGLSAGAL